MTEQTTIIREIAEDVYKTLGSGFSEDVYDPAMQVELVAIVQRFVSYCDEHSGGEALRSRRDGSRLHYRSQQRCTGFCSHRDWQKRNRSFIVAPSTEIRVSENNAPGTNTRS